MAFNTEVQVINKPGTKLAVVVGTLDPTLYTEVSSSSIGTTVLVGTLSGTLEIISFSLGAVESDFAYSKIELSEGITPFYTFYSQSGVINNLNIIRTGLSFFDFRVKISSFRFGNTPTSQGEWVMLYKN